MLSFGRFQLLVEQQCLLLDGIPAHLGARAFDVLSALAQRRDRVVTKAELLDIVWPGLVVEENNLQVQISTLRKLLGPQAITTTPGRGYRFTAAIDSDSPAVEAVNIEPVRAITDVAVHRTNLPDRLLPLIGRDDDVAALLRLVAEHPLVTVIGAGGTGKTLLAQHLLDRQRATLMHGVCWIELAGLSDGSMLTSTVAKGLGVPLGSDQTVSALAAATAPLKILLAIDNAEHLLVDVARMVESLLAYAPGIRVLATSQAPLKVKGEHIYRLEPLGIPRHEVPASEALGFGAVALFVDRAQAADRHFVLTDENVEEVRTLCQRVDGSALAIELAAARLPLLGLSALTSSLDERLRLLTKGSSTAPQRQQTLRSALEWSHRWLGETEQLVFRRLAVVVGSSALPLIQQIVADDSVDRWQVLDALDALVDRSFVAVLGTSPPRYRLLESPRAFALEMLARSGEEASFRQRHAQAVLEHFISTCEASRGLLSDRLVAELEPDHDNARTALTWALEHERVLAVAAAPSLSKSLCAGQQDAKTALWTSTEGCLNEDIDSSLLAGWTTAATSYWADRHPEVGRSWGRRAIALHRGVGDRLGLYEALCAQALSRSATGRDEIRAALDELRSIERPQWPASLRYLGAQAETFVAYYEEDWPQCEATLWETLRLAEEAGSSTGRNSALTNIADMALIKGDAAEAVRLGKDLEAHMAALRSTSRLLFVRQNLLKALLAIDDIVAARAMAEANWQSAMGAGFDLYWLDALTLLAAQEKRMRTAARVRGFTDAAYTANQEKRRIGEFRAVERAASLTRAALGESSLSNLRAQGAAMTAVEIAGIVLAKEDSDLAPFPVIGLPA